MSHHILLSGATGLVGGRLQRVLTAGGAELRALTRNPDAAKTRFGPGVTPIGWDGSSVGREAMSGLDAVVHLAGEPVFGGPLTRARRARILSSRVDSTRALVEAMRDLPQPERPGCFVCASAVGYYGSRGDEWLEESAAPGSGFLADVCQAWEAAAREAEALGIRCVQLRIGIVLANEGGALPMLALPFRVGLGGRLGDGKQWTPWIHIDDLVALVTRCLSDSNFSGPVNASAPEPVTNAELTRTVASVLGRPARIPVPAFALRAALGELATELLGSRRVRPARALEAGFDFLHTEVSTALAKELSPAARFG